MSTTRAHVYVSGYVQGVFFRDRTRRRANSLGLAGWVRNLPDGRVEAVFEGEEEPVNRMLEFMREGPPRAQVADVDVEYDDYTGEYDGFSVRYGY